MSEDSRTLLKEWTSKNPLGITYTIVRNKLVAMEVLPQTPLKRRLWITSI